MRTCENYEVKIWLGLREGYSKKYYPTHEVEEYIGNWCDAVKQCVTMTPTDFIYVGGGEPGLIIGFINYPRFPLEKQKILDRALELGELLKREFNQFRVSVTTPDTSYLLEDVDSSSYLP